MRLNFLFSLVFFFVILMSVSVAADYGPITMREGANIALDGGIIEKFQTKGFYSIEAFGADGSDSNGDGQAIQDCINYTNANGGGYIYAQPGTYLIDIRTKSATDSYNGQLLRMLSDVHLVGIPGKTIFKVADNMRTSTLSCPILMNYDHSAEIKNWSIDGIVFDGNEENNYIEPGWTSKYDGVGAARAANYSITNCEFRDITGYWCILIAYGNGTGVIENNHLTGILSNSTLMEDYSAIYASANNLKINNNVIDPSTKSENATGIELHASETGMANGNVIHNMSSGIYASSSNYHYGNGRLSYTITDNDITVNWIGVATWQNLDKPIDLITITNNKIEYIQTTSASLSNGIEITHHISGPVPWSVRNAIIRGNVIKSGTGANMQYGIQTRCLDRGIIEDNVILGSSEGGIMSYITNDSNTTPTELNINNNVIDGFGTSGIKSGVWVSILDNTQKIRISGNKLNASAADYGVRVYAGYAFTAAVTSLDNTVSGCTYPFRSSVLTGTILADTWGIAAPSVGQWSVGSMRRNSNPSSGGAAFWVCTTAGNPGTWKPCNLSS